MSGLLSRAEGGDRSTLRTSGIMGRVGAGTGCISRMQLPNRHGDKRLPRAQARVPVAIQLKSLLKNHQPEAQGRTVIDDKITRSKNHLAGPIEIPSRKPEECLVGTAGHPARIRSSQKSVVQGGSL